MYAHNKVLLYSPGNYIQYPVVNHNEKEYLKSLYVYNWVTLLYSRDWHILSQLYVNKKLQKSHVQMYNAVLSSKLHAWGLVQLQFFKYS